MISSADSVQAFVESHPVSQVKEGFFERFSDHVTGLAEEQ